jgi:hypothetical protein
MIADTRGFMPVSVMDQIDVSKQLSYTGSHGAGGISIQDYAIDFGSTDRIRFGRFLSPMPAFTVSPWGLSLVRILAL